MPDNTPVDIPLQHNSWVSLYFNVRLIMFIYFNNFIISFSQRADRSSPSELVSLSSASY